MHRGDAILAVEKELSRARVSQLNNPKSTALEFRFFEIYRSAEYVNLILEGTAVSAAITLAAGIFGFLVAFGQKQCVPGGTLGDRVAVGCYRRKAYFYA